MPPAKTRLIALTIRLFDAAGDISSNADIKRLLENFFIKNGRDDRNRRIRNQSVNFGQCRQPGSARHSQVCDNQVKILCSKMEKISV